MANFDGKTTFRRRARAQFINAVRRRRLDRQGALLGGATAAGVPVVPDGFQIRRARQAKRRAVLRPKLSAASRVVRSNNAFNRESITMFDIAVAPPGAPTITSLTPGDSQVAVAFSPPVSDGGGTITDYVVEYRELNWPTSVDGTNKTILDQNGNRWFGRGDTSWSLVGQLSVANQNSYVDKAVAAGFDLTLLSIPEPYYTDNTPAYRNQAGDDPFTGTLFASSLNAAYWDPVETLIEYGAARGLTFLICPQYSGFADNQDGWSQDVEAAYTANPTNLTTYGQALVARFGAYENVMWLIGHDRAPTANFKAASKLIADELAAGTSQLICHGGWNASNTNSTGDTDWNAVSGADIATDFDTVYVYDETVGESVAAARVTKTSIFLEGKYEQEQSQAVGDQTLREQTWEAFCAGASAAIFGNNPRWHFESGKEIYGFSGTWQDSFDNATYNDGTVHQGYFFDLLDTIAWQDTVPDTTGTLLTSGTGYARFSVNAAIIYQSAAASITIDTTELSGSGNVRIRRFDPTTGTFVATVAASEAQDGARVITHPGANVGGGNDYVYVVDLVAAPVDTSPWTVFSDGTGTTSPITVTGLTNGHEYIFRIAAVNSAGQGTYSAETQASTPLAPLTVADARSASTIDNLTLIQHQILTIADATSASTVDNVALTQHQLLTVADATSGSAVDNVSLTQHHVLAVGDATSASTIESVTLVQRQILVVADARSTSTVDNLALTQHQVLAVADATSTSTVDAISLGVNLVVNDATSVSTIDNVVLSTAASLSVADATSASTVDNLALVQHQILAVNDATSASTVDNLALTQHQVLAVQDATSASTVDNLALVQHQALAVADARSASTVDNVALVQHQVLTVADATSASTVDNLTLVQHQALVVADATSASTVDNVALTQHHVLAVNDATSASTIESVTLTPAGALAVQDAQSASTIDNLALTQHQVLAVADTSSSTTIDGVSLVVNLVVNDAAAGSTIDNVNLTQHQVLAVADARSTSTVDNVVLVQHQAIAINDAASASTIDALVLTQHQVLAVADSTSSSTIDNVALTSGATLAVADARSSSTIDSLALTQHQVLVVADARSTSTIDNVVLVVGSEIGFVTAIIVAPSVSMTVTSVSAAGRVVAGSAIAQLVSAP